MSKHTAPFARRLQVTALIALASAAPAFAKAPTLPETFAVRTSNPTATLVKTAEPVRSGGSLAMNVALTCVRTGTRMVC